MVNKLLIFFSICWSD